MGIQWGTSLELVWNWLANPMFSFGNVWGVHRGCWEMSGELIRDYYELFGKQLVFIGAPWRISGDFRLGIHSLGEVQIQTEHILTHAISLQNRASRPMYSQVLF